VIVEVLDCQQATLQVLGPRDGRLYYAVGSGFTPEREEYLREKRGCYLPSEFVDETVFARLSANQEVILPADRLRLPPGFQEDFGAKNFLLIPLFLENQLVAALSIAKACFDGKYTLEDIKLVKVVAMKAILVIECLRRSHEQAEMWARDLERQEMHRLINEFLDLASHELKTPLTAVKGNIQLAQRRLAKLKRQIAELPGRVREQIERVQYSLESAVQSTRLQEHIIKNLIDDAHIQANTFELHMKLRDLVVLLKEAVAAAQCSVPERTIVLDITPAQKAVPIMVDAERIAQVINSYLEHALSRSPVDQPVTVHLTVEDTLARVSVHDAGPAIPYEEQEHIWERFYNAEEIAAQHQAGPILGLDLYLCRVFIERHHGNVGVHSDPGHGATYWFTLPIEASAQSEQ
jgi:signal transduction histidine kinase